MPAGGPSDGGSPPGRPSRRFNQQEVDSVAAMTVKERSRDSVTIAVMREIQGLTGLLRKMNELVPRPPGSVRKDVPPTVLTTARGLLGATKGSPLLLSYPECTNLNIIVSSKVSQTTFQVPSRFTQLRVLRCGSPDDKPEFLYVDGASTYNNVRLDKWQAHRHEHHTLILDHEGGVRIGLHGISRRVADLHSSSWLQDWLSRRWNKICDAWERFRDRDDDDSDDDEDMI